MENCEGKCKKTKESDLKKAISCGNNGLCMKKSFSAAVEGRKAEMERRNEEAQQEVSKSVKREVVREGGRVEIKFESGVSRICRGLHSLD